MPVLTNAKHERLKELLEYNPETGDFVWRKTFFRMTPELANEAYLHAAKRLFGDFANAGA